MKTPSIKTLQTLPDVDANKARQLKHILTAPRSVLETMPAGAARVAECWNPPATSDLRMTCLDAELGTYGVEGFHTSKGAPVLYLNTGETYAPTIVRIHGNYRVTSWGDVAERHGAQ